jgi:hypothetical protein
MSSAKLVVAGGLAAVALSACGITPMPAAGTPNLLKQPGFHGALDGQRHSHATCIRSHGLPVTSLRRSVPGTPGTLPALQVGTAPSGPTIVFEPTPGAAQAAQIDSDVQGAEVIGAALVYPNQAPDSEMAIVESCTALGVSG